MRTLLKVRDDSVPNSAVTSKFSAIIIPCVLSGEGRDSSVGIATRYGLHDTGIESRWGLRFSAPVQFGHGAQRASYTIGTGVFLGGKAAGAWR
jgi:hypothetical protein